MFCYQCEQTAMGKGCIKAGVCGKTGETADLQDALRWIATGISMYADHARKFGAIDSEVDVFVNEALFTTVTNVNFDPDSIEKLIRKGVQIREKARNLYVDAAIKAGQKPEILSGAAVWEPAADKEGLVAQNVLLSVDSRKHALGDDLAGVLEMIVYGLKGIAAYTDHAHVLGVDDPVHYGKIHEILAFTGRSVFSAEELLDMAMQTGHCNLIAMELLDKANTTAYGHPVPTSVRINPVKGKAILISGHDLKDLKFLLEATKDKGINIYTHGEMLPAHGYPELKKYPHLAGNYGGAWQDQQKEFDEFPGAILMTTNCIQKPRETYIGRIFTTGLVEFPNVVHVTRDDFSPVIEAALAAPGFTEDGDGKTIMVGFGHNAVMGVAGAVIDAVKAGQIRHFFLVGGCDGAKSGRNYYTEFVQKLPKDTVILTLACGKYRFNKLELGDIGGIPRLLDIGQCNDAYSAIQIALALSKAFGVGVNELPLSLILSWYEQKAVAILLTLLALGIKNIRLGPTLPAFITPAILGLLVEKFGIKPVTTPDEDIKAILG